MGVIILIIDFAIFIYSVILHEISHGWAADYLGDPTARLSGRLTLNPLPHIDPMMTLALPLLLYWIGGPIFGGAKPVPIDPYNFREPKKDTAITAAAGPATNLAIALAFALLFRVLSILPVSQTIQPIFWQIAQFAIQINVFLAIFNLLPIPPLDGFKVIGGLLPDELAKTWYSFERFGMILIFIALFLFLPAIESIVYPISSTVIRFLLIIARP